MKKIYIYLLFNCFLLKAFSQNNWEAVGGGMNGTVLDLVSDTVNNKLYAGGSFTFSGSEFTPYISVWDGTKWAGLGTGMNGPVHALCMYKGNLYAGGRFTTAGGVNAKNIAKWNGTSWEALGSGVDSTVYCLKTFANELYIGGVFKKSGTTQTGYLVKCNDSTIQKVGTTTTSGLISQYSSANWQGVYDLQVFKNNLYLVGFFDSLNHVRCYPLLKYDGFNYSNIITGWNGIFSAGVYKNNIYFAPEGLVQAYDGSSFQPIYFQYESFNEMWDMLEYKNKLILAGTYSNIDNNSSKKYITTFDGSTISLLGNSINNGVRAVEIYNGDIFIGGRFTNVSNSATDNIAKISGEIITGNNETKYTDLGLKILQSSNNHFIVKNTTNIERSNFPVEIELINTNGNVVYSGQFQETNNDISFKTKEQLSTAIYFVRITNNQGTLLNISKFFVK